MTDEVDLHVSFYINVYASTDVPCLIRLLLLMWDEVCLS